MRAKRLIEARRRGRAALAFGTVYVKFGVVLAALLYLAIPASCTAITTISQGYSSKGSLALGSIVSLQHDSSDVASAATESNVDGILGVVIDNNDSLLSLSSGQTNQIQVATSGVVQVLVSNINGNISEGDQITASPISGVGMKATDSIKVVGIAQGALSSSNESKQSYVDKGGQKHSVMVGEIPIIINVAYYYKQPSKTIIPSTIQKVANALAGKPVNSLPILISAGIFIVTMMVVASIIYSMIRSSIISVGRNPMSQSAIYRDIIQLSALVVGILVVAAVAIYLILTRF